MAAGVSKGLMPSKMTAILLPSRSDRATSFWAFLKCPPGRAVNE